MSTSTYVVSATLCNVLDKRLVVELVSAPSCSALRIIFRTTQYVDPTLMRTVGLLSCFALLVLLDAAPVRCCCRRTAAVSKRARCMQARTVCCESPSTNRCTNAEKLPFFVPSLCL